MTNTDEQDAAMFARLARQEPALRAYLQRQFDQQVAVLVVNQTPAQIHIAQGRAQVLRELAVRLDEAKRV
jgi:hypothetical protein